MKLQPNPFEKIKKGLKTIEIRLNDEKRQQLKVGDEIVFSLINDSSKKIKTRILDLLLFSDFKELFYSFPPEEYGGASKDEYESMYEYYSKEDEEKYGVLAIRLNYLGD